MSEITKTIQRKETAPSKIITIGTTDINIGHSLREIIEFIQEKNEENIPVSIWTCQSEKGLKLTLPFQFSSPLASLFPESLTILVEKLKEQEIKLPGKGATRTEINPIGFFAAISKKNIEDGIQITDILIHTKQTKSEIQSEIKKVTGNNIPKNWIFNSPK